MPLPHDDSSLPERPAGSVPHGLLARLRRLPPEPVMLAIALLVLVRHPHAVAGVGLALAGGTLLLLRLLWPAAHRRVEQALQRAQGRLAAGLSWLATAAAFFLVITPVALLLRAAGRDPLRLRRQDAHASLWQAPPDRAHDDDFFKAQF